MELKANTYFPFFRWSCNGHHHFTSRSLYYYVIASASERWPAINVPRNFRYLPRPEELPLEFLSSNSFAIFVLLSDTYYAGPNFKQHMRSIPEISKGGVTCSLALKGITRCRPQCIVHISQLSVPSAKE